MPEELDSAVRGVVPNSPEKASRPRSRRFVKLGSILVIVLVLLGLLVTFAPRYTARYLIAAELDKLGIDYAGVDSLEINPWTRELWLGSVRFGGGQSEQGQLGELGLRISFNPLLDRRVSIEQMVVSGIEVVVTRSKDNRITLNGIALDRLPEPAEKTRQPAGEGKAWGAGIDDFELRDSRLIFQDRTHGDLEVDVERLTLSGFQTWEPERPGRVELTARVNDIQLNWTGEARPFADNITLDIDSRTEGADVPKLTRFTGPWGLDRQDGSYNAHLKYQVTLFDSGRLEGLVTGSIDIEGADYERAGVFALAMERADVELDLSYTLNEAGDLALQGQTTVALGSTSSAVADKTRLAVAAGHIVMSGLDVAYAKNGSLSVAARPDIDLQQLAFSGPIEISLDKMLELLTLLQSISAAGAVTTADTGLSDFADGSVVVPSSDIELAQLKSAGGSFELRSAGGEVELGLKSRTDLSDIQISTAERKITVQRWNSVLEKLNLKSGQGRLTLEMVGGNALATGTATGPLGELKIDALEAKTDKLAMQTQTGVLSLQLTSATEARGFSALVYSREALPEVQIELGQVSASLSQASLDAEGNTLRWQAAGDAGLGPLSAEFAKGKEGALKFVHTEIKALQADQRLQIAADALTVDGLDLYVKRSLLEALNPGAGETPVESGAAEKVAAAPEVDVSQVQKLLTGLGYAPGSVDGRMGGRTAAAIEAFQRKEGLIVDGRLTKQLLTALQMRAAGPPAGESEPAGPGVRLGLLALTGRPVVRFRDDVVTPQVKIDTVFKEAQVRNLDTQKRGQRTDVQIAADVNEFTQVKLAGWTAGFDKGADMEFKAEVENLELSGYSPYAAELAGVNLEGGQLNTVATGKVVLGGLQGEIQIDLDDVAFGPLSKEDAERLTGSMGVPLETAVGLLQDDDGRILLTLPVSGTVSEPDVDISSAVNKAIAGALKAAFPPTMIASFLSGAAKGAGPAFESIEFKPGSAELDEAGKRYADGVAKLLAERPKLSLRVCGRATAQDGTALSPAGSGSTPPKPAVEEQIDRVKEKAVPDPSQAKQALSELAVERQKAVRLYLVQEKGADVKRIRECRSTYEATDLGTPRVEFSL